MDKNGWQDPLDIRLLEELSSCFSGKELMRLVDFSPVFRLNNKQLNCYGVCIDIWTKMGWKP